VNADTDTRHQTADPGRAGDPVVVLLLLAAVVVVLAFIPAVQPQGHPELVREPAAQPHHDQEPAEDDEHRQPARNDQNRHPDESVPSQRQAQWSPRWSSYSSMRMSPVGIGSSVGETSSPGSISWPD